MGPATEAQESALAHLERAKLFTGDAIKELEGARDALNREHPARHVALAITAVEDGELRVQKALAELEAQMPTPSIDEMTELQRQASEVMKAKMDAYDRSRQRSVTVREGTPLPRSKAAQDAPGYSRVKLRPDGIAKDAAKLDSVIGGDFEGTPA